MVELSVSSGSSYGRRISGSRSSNSKLKSKNGSYLRGGHSNTSGAPRPPRVVGGAAAAMYQHPHQLPADPYLRTANSHSKERSSSRNRGYSNSGSSSSRNHAAVFGRPKGLLNVGNTCYANAALQCLLSTALTHALIDPKASAIFRRYSSNPNLLEQGSGSVDSADIRNTGGGSGSQEENEPEDTEKERQHQEARLLRAERRRRERDDRRMKETCTWLTRELKAITLEYQHPETPQVRAAVQQASSTNNYMMSTWLMSPAAASASVVVDPGCITKHPNRLSKCLVPYQQEDAHEFLRALLSTLVMNGQNKQLSSLFDGLLESAVTCLHCRRPSLTRDRYMDLSLDICASHVETLADALQEFTKTETLTGDNKVYCQKCDMKRPATKGLRLATAPSILVCHLKRFAFDPYGRLVRLAKKVQFPLRLEIGDYMSRVNKARPPPYELVAVLVHQGQTCDSGHYLAYVKNAGLWYRCNDSIIEQVDVATVLKQQAYILLYEVEEMRSRNGYSSPSGSQTCHLNRPSSSGSLGCKSDSDWAFLNGWREYIFSTSLCGMDDSLLREFCWDVNNCSLNPKRGGRRKDGSSVSGGSSGRRSNSRRRRRNGNEVGNRSNDSSTHHDAHDDLSTLGESTVESVETAGKIPFRRISSSGNLNAMERFRNQYHHHSNANYPHSTVRTSRQHFFNSTSDPDSLQDFYAASRPPWPATTPSNASTPVMGSTMHTIEPSDKHQQESGVAGNGGGRATPLAARARNELPPRPDSGGVAKELRQQQQQQLQLQQLLLETVPSVPSMQPHRRAASVSNIPDVPPSPAQGEVTQACSQQYHV